MPDDKPPLEPGSPEIQHSELNKNGSAGDAAAMFEDRGPIGHKGRNSIPRSHRGEGFNYVD